MIYKWDVPSIQCEKRVRQSMLVREIDRLSLVLIDFNIPAFTPGCRRVKPTLEFSYYVTLLAVCRIYEYTSVIRKEG
jgi:hypothetical protein